MRTKKALKMDRKDTCILLRIDRETKNKASSKVSEMGISMADFLRLCIDDLNDGGEMTKIATYARFKKMFRKYDQSV